MTKNNFYGVSLLLPLILIFCVLAITLVAHFLVQGIESGMEEKDEDDDNVPVLKLARIVKAVRINYKNLSERVQEYLDIIFFRFS